ITSERARELNLDRMTDEITDPYETAFTVSVDHQSTETGISAFERATTIKSLVDKNAMASDFKRPGHVFPLVAKEGGVFVRKGQTEAAIELAKLCLVIPSAVNYEISNKDRTMARLP